MYILGLIRTNIESRWINKVSVVEKVART